MAAPSPHLLHDLPDKKREIVILPFMEKQRSPVDFPDQFPAEQLVLRIHFRNNLRRIKKQIFPVAWSFFCIADRHMRIIVRYNTYHSRLIGALFFVQNQFPRTVSAHSDLHQIVKMKMYLIMTIIPDPVFSKKCQNIFILRYLIEPKLDGIFLLFPHNYSIFSPLWQRKATRRDSSIPLRSFSPWALTFFCNQLCAPRRDSSIPLRFFSLWAVAL